MQHPQLSKIKTGFQGKSRQTDCVNSTNKKHESHKLCFWSRILSKPSRELDRIFIGRGGGNRTPDKGFGDPCDTTSPRPRIRKETNHLVSFRIRGRGDVVSQGSPKPLSGGRFPPPLPKKIPSRH